MNYDILHETTQKVQAHQRKKRWLRIVSGMAAVVVFCTTYALILPAITLDKTAACGFEEHQHEESCYSVPDMQQFACVPETDLAVHTHNESCTDEAGNQVCALAELTAHTHDDSCYAEQTIYLCGMESGAGAHAHTEVCYQTEELTCELPEQEAHSHSEDCYTVNSDLICTLEECESHAHGESCHESVSELVCTKAEQEAHAHGETCYTASSSLICTLEASDEHTHEDGCYEAVSELTCTLPECEGHAHDVGCYTAKDQLVCQLEETIASHAHGEECYESSSELTCTLPECDESHAHSPLCYVLSEEPLCGLEESEGHIHDDTCPTEIQVELTCTIREIILHTHDDSCLDESGALICDMPAVLEHIHDENCPTATVAGTVSVAVCGMSEHTHEDACYPAEETIPDTDEGIVKYLCESGEHTHGETCYDEAGSLTCTIPQHTHGAACVTEDVDLTADIETAAQWEATFADVERTGNWPADILAIAETQLGYTESKKNVILVGEKTLHGYTRYGDWYGDHYGDWCAMFISFCMNYAGVENYPLESNCNAWISALQESGLYYNYNEYTPNPGDIIFFDWQQRSVAESEVSADHVGLVAELIRDEDGNLIQIKTIEGNSGDAVQYVTYDLTDKAIIGYGHMPEGITTTLTYEGEDFTVTVVYGMDAKIPATAQLAVREILSGTEEFDTYYQQSIDTLLGTDAAAETADASAETAEASEEETSGITFARFFDIGFVVDGENIEPSAPVDIQIRYHDSIEMLSDQNSVAIHFADDGIEVLNASTSRTEDGLVDSFQFTQDSFSVTGNIVTYASKAVNSIPTADVTAISADGDIYYVLYTKSNDKYYAISADGSAVEINVENGIVTSSVSDNLLWSFTGSGTSYTIRNKGNTSRYLYPSSNGVTRNSSANATVTVNATDNTVIIYRNNRYAYLQGTSFNASNNSNSSFYLAQTNFHVWLDGTCGTMMSYYGSPNEYRAVTAGETFTLPSTWESPTKYEYVLKGWYDIYGHKYYPAGSPVTLTQNTVFYAYWEAASYDFATSESPNRVKNQVDTRDFITTRVFDYNILFNLMTNVVDTSNSITYLNADGHMEYWSQLEMGKTTDYYGANYGESLGFIFRDYDWTWVSSQNTSKHIDISWPEDTNPDNTNQGYITPNIISDVGNNTGRNLIGLLFNKDTAFNTSKSSDDRDKEAASEDETIAANAYTDVIGKKYLGSGDWLYQYMDETTSNYDGIHNGYYYYDSALNSVSYSESDGRFYVFNYLERTTDSEKTQSGDAHGRYSDILPFNSSSVNTNGTSPKTYTGYQLKYDSSLWNQIPGYTYDAKDIETDYCTANQTGANYLFGFSSLFDFYLPNDTNETDEYGRTGNRSLKGDEMIFKFQGDDDVWIYIDNDLVVDIGGIHGIESGTINLSKGTITTSGRKDNNDATFTDTIDLKSGDHRITILYMERGSSQSNASIYFNLAPRFSLEIFKKDALTADVLNGAIFSVYMDAACTEPAVLWNNSDDFYKEQADGVKRSTNSFKVTIDENKIAKASCWGIVQGETYYIKETTPPSRYQATDDVIRITTSNDGTAKIYSSVLAGTDGKQTEGFGVESVSLREDIHLIQLTVDNQDQEYVSLEVTKTWSEDTEEKKIPESITVYLSTKDGDKYVVDKNKSLTLTADDNWTGSWTLLPKYDASGKLIEYSIEEDTVSGFTYTLGALTEKPPTIITKMLNTTSFTASTTEKEVLHLLVSPAGALVAGSNGSLDWEPDLEFAAADTDAQWIATASGNGGFKLTTKSGRSLYLNNNTFRTSSTNSSVMTFSGHTLSSGDQMFGVFTSTNNGYYATATTTDPVSFEVYQLATETIVTGYSIDIENTPVDETTSVTVTKIWADDDTVDHSNDTVTVRLYADGVATDRTATLSATSTPAWTATFADLPYKKTDSDTLIVYSIVEDPINHYEASYGSLVKYSEAAGHYIVAADPNNEGHYIASITNTPVYYALPDTGSTGTGFHLFGGIAIMAAATILGCFNWRKRRKEAGNHS